MSVLTLRDGEQHSGVVTDDTECPCMAKRGIFSFGRLGKNARTTAGNITETTPKGKSLRFAGLHTGAYRSRRELGRVATFATVVVAFYLRKTSKYTIRSREWLYGAAKPTG